MWKGQGRSGYGESSTGGDYDDWSCLSRNGRQWKNPSTMLTRDLSGADYWHIRKQMTDSYDVPLEVYAENDTVNLAHTLPSGKANLLAYADPVQTKKKTSVPLVDRILPQQRRVRVLTEQLIELEAERKAGMDIHTYSKLRDVLICKRDRAEVLYRKAVSVKPIKTDEDAFDYQDETPEDEAETIYSSYDTDSTNPPTPSSHWLDDFIAELPDRNCFKNVLKIALHVTRKAVHYKHKAATYLNALKEV